eukprot:COSAG05_NODE_3996_length_1729_cov_1.693252_2_plen_91_part_00
MTVSMIASKKSQQSFDNNATNGGRLIALQLLPGLGTTQRLPSVEQLQSDLMSTEVMAAELLHRCAGTTVGVKLAEALGAVAPADGRRAAR